MEFFDVVTTQRSIRRFKPDPVPDDVLWKMLDAAIRAPSGSNLQPWRWLVVRDAVKRDAIATALRERRRTDSGMPSLEKRLAEEPDPSVRRMIRSAFEFLNDIAQAPVLVIPCLYWLSSPTRDPATLLAGSSIYAAVQNFMLAARAQGIGTVLTTFHDRIDDVLRAELKLPDDTWPVCMVPVGYPDGQGFGPTTRKPVETVTYWDEWSVTRARYRANGRRT